MREVVAQRLAERRAEDDSSSLEEDSLLGSDGDEDGLLQPLANQHWASGSAGIDAARRALAKDKAMKQKRKQPHQEGDGDDEELRGVVDEEEEEEERGNVKFTQPIKERRAAISAAKKQKKALEGNKGRRSRD